MASYVLTVDPYIPDPGTGTQNWGTRISWSYPTGFPDGFSPIRLFLQRSPVVGDMDWPLQPNFVREMNRFPEDSSQPYFHNPNLPPPAPLNSGWVNIAVLGGAVPPGQTEYWDHNNAQPNPTFNYRLVMFEFAGGPGHWFEYDWAVATTTRSPQGFPVWVLGVGSSGVDYATAVAVDSSGNSFVTGIFNGSVDFGGTTLTSAGGYDIFVAKYDINGTLVWVYSYGGAGSEQSFSITLDNSGNIFVCGQFPTGQLLKLNSSGATQWVKGPVATGNQSVKFASVSCDSSGGAVVTGNFVAGFNTPLDFGDSHPLVSSAGSTDAFVAKYNSSGTCVFARTFTNFGDTEFGTSVYVDKAKGDTILISGYAFSGIDLGGGDMENGAYGAYGFLGRLQSDGSYNASATVPSWQRMVGTKLSSDGTAPFCRLQRMTVDSAGDIIVGCEWNYVTNFGANAGDASGGRISATTSFNSLALAKYSGTNGHFILVRPIVGAQGSAGALVTDSQKNICFSGSFIRDLNFGSVTLTSANQPGTFQTSDVFVAKYDLNGVPLWAAQYGGTDSDSGTGIGVAPNNFLIVAGGFKNNLDGSPASFGSITKSSHGDFDMYLMKITS